MKTTLLTFIFALLFLNLTAQNEIIYLDTPYAIEAAAAKLEMADLDGNGIPEMIVCDINGISIYNIDDYENYSWQRWDVGSELDFIYSNLSTKDIDSDGDIDIILMGVNVIHVYFNHGELVFEQKHIFTGLANPMARELSFPDLDNDGDFDIVAGFDGSIFWIENVDTWTDYIIHQIPYEGPLLRGITALDWDQDGDTDIMTQPGAVAYPISVLLQEDGTWVEFALAETNGGIFNVHTADINGDQIPEVGVATLVGPLIINTVSNEVQNIPQNLLDFDFPEGGQFLDYYGHQIWIQCNWPEGNIVYNTISSTGEINDFVPTDIFIPNAHDFVLYDGDKNGYLDLFFSCYNGENLIGVIPDIDLGIVNIPTPTHNVPEENVKLFHYDRTLTFIYPDEVNPKRLDIFDISGRLIYTTDIEPNQKTFSLPDELISGNYVARYIETRRDYSLKFTINN